MPFTVSNQTDLNSGTINQIIATTITASGSTSLTDLTVSGTETLTKSSNQVVLQPNGAGNTLTLNAGTPGQATVLTISDPSVSSSNFVLTDGNQTINGNKTFTGTVTIPSVPTSSLTLTGSSNQLIVQPGGSGFKFIATASNPGQDTTLTIPDPLTSAASFVLNAGNSTIAGNKTFSGTTVLGVTNVGSALTLKNATN